MSAPMEWRVATDMLAAVLPTLARSHGPLHLEYDLPCDQWIVVNDGGYAALRQRGVEALRAALADDDGEVGA